MDEIDPFLEDRQKFPMTTVGTGVVGSALEVGEEVFLQELAE